MKIIAISGMLGTGKTTLCNALSQMTGWTVIREDIKRNVFLPLFYHDMEKWALASQLTFMLNKTEEFEGSLRTNADFVLVDRTIDEDFFVFARTLQKYEIISSKEHALIERIYSLLKSRWVPVDLTIYLNDTDENCYERILRRGDAFESKIELGYVRSVGEAYREWQWQFLKAPYLQLNPSSADFREPRNVRKILEEIQLILKV